MRFSKVIIAMAVVTGLAVSALLQARYQVFDHIDKKAISAFAEKQLGRAKTIVQPKESAQNTATEGAKTMHKCVTGETVLYTNEACPKGAKMQSIKNGTVSIMPSVSVAKPAPEKQSANMHEPTTQKALGDY